MKKTKPPDENKDVNIISLEDNQGAPPVASRKRKKLFWIIPTVILGAALVTLLVIFVILPLVKYNHATDLLSQKQFDEAISIFESLGDYRDSAVMVKEATYQKANDLLLNKEYDEAIVIFTDLEEYKDSKDLIKEANYQKANDLLLNKEYDAAIALFTGLADYKDSGNLLDEARYLMAKQYLADGEYYYASEIFQELGVYKDSADLLITSNYSQALLYYQLGLFDPAKSLFETMPTYEESSRYIGLLNGLINIQGTWQVVSGDRQHVFIGWKYFMVDDPYGENIITEGTLEESYINEDLIRFTTYVTGYFVNYDMKNNLFTTEFFVYGSQKWGFKTYSVIEEYGKINIFTTNVKILDLLEPDLLTMVETYPYLADFLPYLLGK